MKDRVLFLGAISRSKGASVFMDAIGQCEAAQRDSTFVVIGDFTDENRRFMKRWDEMKELTRVRLSGARTEFLGHVTTYEVIRQIKLARVVVVPSLFDPFARAVVESLIMGRPVITTDRVGAAALVQEHKCGLVVAPGDPVALAQAIDEALSPRASFAHYAEQLAHNKVLNDYSPEIVAIHLAYHLDRIAAPK